MSLTPPAPECARIRVSVVIVLLASALTLVIVYGPAGWGAPAMVALMVIGVPFIVLFHVWHFIGPTRRLARRVDQAVNDRGKGVEEIDGPITRH